MTWHDRYVTYVRRREARSTWIAREDPYPPDTIGVGLLAALIMVLFAIGLATIV